MSELYTEGDTDGPVNLIAECSRQQEGDDVCKVTNLDGVHIKAMPKWPNLGDVEVGLKVCSKVYMRRQR